MKKVILSALALSTGSFAFAQTPQTIVNPGQQVSPVVPTAVVGGNYSNIDQKGQGSDALVQQQGTSNISFIEQTGTNAANRNSVDVLQWGNVQPAISGQLNYSDIKQDGEGNTFTVAQQGDYNEVFGTSTGTDNTALVMQGATAPQQGEANLSLVDQDGRENNAEVQQRYDNNDASIVQRNDVATGVGNSSYQEQIANPNMSSGHTAIGAQYGDGNALVQEQRGLAGLAGDGNYAEASQGDVGTDATRAYARQLQTGERNEAYATQYGMDNELFQEQLGTDNTAVGLQNTLPTNGGGNLLEQYQDGSGNYSEADQNGNNNEAFQEQRGMDNTSLITQRQGQVAGNVAIALQEGSNHDSVIHQKTNGNLAEVDQTGNGQMSVITQNFPQGNGASPAGTGQNTATVVQRNANISLSVRQAQRARQVRTRF